jgi:hypothetical protein
MELWVLAFTWNAGCSSNRTERACFASEHLTVHHVVLHNSYVPVMGGKDSVGVMFTSAHGAKAKNQDSTGPHD